MHIRPELVKLVKVSSRITIEKDGRNCEVQKASSLMGTWRKKDMRLPLHSMVQMRMQHEAVSKFMQENL